MAGIRKHGLHRVNLTLSALAAGAAADAQDVFPYDAFVVGTSDASQEAIYEAYIAFNAALIGQATNFSSFALQQARNNAILNDIRVSYNAAGVTTPIYGAINLAVAEGAVVPGAGTGVLVRQAGTVLPWFLLPGDVIIFSRISSGTGQATPAVGLGTAIGARGA